MTAYTDLQIATMQLVDLINARAGEIEDLSGKMQKKAHDVVGVARLIEIAKQLRGAAAVAAAAVK